MNCILKQSNALMKFGVVAGLLSLLILAGCGAMIHSAVVKSLPTYSETKSAWPPVPESMGRVVIYYPRLSGAGIGVGGYDSRSIQVDGKYKTLLEDQTFIYIDLDGLVFVGF